MIESKPNRLDALCGAPGRVVPESWPSRIAPPRHLTVAAFAVALAVAVTSHGPPPSGAARSGLQRRLVPELGPVDLGPGRFVGLAPAPFGSGSRPEWPAQRALRSQLSAVRDASPDQLTDFAVLRLLAADVRGALRLLETAGQADPKAPKLLSDLAAAHLRAAHLGLGVHHLVLALDVVEHALRMEPQLAEARFNQAATLQELGQDVQARTAWGEYLRQGAGDGWDEEGRRRLKALLHEDPRQRWERVRRELIEACRRSDLATVRGLMPGYGYETRELIEGELLPRWAGEVEDRSWEAADDLLAVAGCVARGRAETLNSPLLAAAIARLEVLQERRETRSLDEFAAAHLALRRGLKQAESFLFEEAEEQFAAAEAALRRGDNPLALRAAAEVAATRFQAHDYLGVLATLDAIDRAPEGRSEPSLAARVLWLRGLVHFVRAQNERALECYLAGLAAAETAQDATAEAALAHLAGETLIFTGAEEVAWPYLLAALRRLPAVRQPHVAYRVASGAAYAALHAGRLGAAIGFQREATRITLAAGQPTMGVLALQRRALLESRLGDQAAALHSLEAAELLALDVPAGEQRAGLTADLALAEGEIHLASGSYAAAAAAFDGALAGLEATSYRFPLVRALTGRAQALRRAGSPERARPDLARGVREVLSQRGEVAPDQRVAFLDAAAPLFEELAANLVEIEQRPDRALLAADLLRARTLVEDGPVEDLESVAPPRLLADLRQALPQRSALLELLVLEDRTYAWFIDQETMQFATLAEGAEHWTAEVERFRRSIQRGAAGCPEGRRLFDQLLGPFRNRLSTVSTLFLVADGALHRLPFGALCSESGRLLVEDHQLARLPSASFLLAAVRRTPRPSAAAASAEVLVVGDPEIDRRLFPHLPTLNASRSEAKGIAARYPSARLLLGARASRSEVLAALPEYEVLHFATHSLVQEAGGENSALVLAPGADGAGLLSARDLAALRLPRHPVVVLSVCGSAVGQPSRSEGQLSLARAFLRAGAIAVVATHWPVEDKGAAAFSHQLHRRLIAGLPPLDAVRQAQLSLLHGTDPSLAAPSVWAAFDLIGFGAATAPLSREVSDVHTQAVGDGSGRLGAGR